MERSPRILDAFAQDLRQTGFAGDLHSAQLLYLSLVSRLLDRPVSVALKGPSAGGKSYLLKSVLAYFPPDAYHEVSCLTSKALAYLAEPLAHRMLIVAEAEGAQGRGVEYQLRTLLSEGQLINEAPVNRDGRWVTERFVVMGPTGLIITTTRLRLHPENETRLISLEIRDSPAQTQAIFHAQAEGAMSGKEPAARDFTQWHAHQEGLKQDTPGIIIPYARQLASRMPVRNAVRLRRDFDRVLQLIKAHALLHRASRERDADGRIATLDDYRVVHELIAGPMAVELETTTSDEVRETVEAVRRLSAGGSATALSALARELRLDKSSVSRRIRHAGPRRLSPQSRIAPGLCGPSTVGRGYARSSGRAAAPRLVRRVTETSDVLTVALLRETVQGTLGIHWGGSGWFHSPADTAPLHNFTMPLPPRRLARPNPIR